MRDENDGYRTEYPATRGQDIKASFRDCFSFLDILRLSTTPIKLAGGTAGGPAIESVEMSSLRPTTSCNAYVWPLCGRHS